MRKLALIEAGEVEPDDKMNRFYIKLYTIEIIIFLLIIMHVAFIFYKVLKIIN